MSKKNPPGDKGSFLASIRRTPDRFKRWIGTSSKPQPGRPANNASDQHPRPSSVAGAHSGATAHGPHLLAPTPLTTHLRGSSAPDLTPIAGSLPYPSANITPHADDQVNPSDENTGGRDQAWLGLKTALGGLHQTVKLFPALHEAIGSFLSCFELFQAAAKHRQDYDRLASDLEALVAMLNRHLRDSGSTALSDSVNNIVMSLKIELEKASQKSKQSTTTGVIRAHEDEEALMEIYQRINDLFRYLQIDANLSTWSIANEHLAKTRLEDTQPAKLASYDAALPADIVRRTCTESTRTAILSGLDEWSCDPFKAKVYWMNGMAGTGKTTIACSLCEALKKRKQLGASFFCSRSLPECRDARKIIPTIAYQLAQYSRPFKWALCKVLENDSDLWARKIQMQFEQMLKGPLMEVSGAIPGNVLVVIDALDECDNGTHVRELLDELFRSALDLPLKFFLTSRPEPGISSRIMSQNSGTRAILRLHEIEESLVQADVELYLQEGLSAISPSTSEIKQLAELAGSLFIYAATAVRYIVPVDSNVVVNSQERLQAIVSGTSGSIKQHAELDALYMTILKGALNASMLEPKEIEERRRVVWTAVSVREPVAAETLAVIAGVDPKETYMILQSLQSVLRISRDMGLVSTLHASFPDFINSSERSQVFHCSIKHIGFIAAQCFSLMRTGLRFNICELESSFILDESIQDLEQRVAKHISAPLSYVCRYWGDHLSSIDSMNQLGTELEEFLAHRLLFWMEVLSLSRLGTLGVHIIYDVHQWLGNHRVSPSLFQRLYDARVFVTSFVQNPVATSTPHIYISALPFCHKSSLVYSAYWERMKGLTNIGGTALDQRSGTMKWTTNITIKTIAVSTFGDLVAFGGYNSDKHGMIGVMDYHTGAHILPVFKGHTQSVNSVAFSPNGSLLVSASSDQSISTWNASNGKLAYNSISGHADEVSSVGFSPNGTLIASGSYDKTVRIWQSHNGQVASSPFEGHTDAVTCIAFSPDGARIVSGSRDSTIRVWSIPDWSAVAGPFQIDDGYWVRSVAFSLDGSRVAVGFNGGLSMWDIHAGQLVPEYFPGHNRWTSSVTFSPDYSRIVSAYDSSSIIHTWDSQTGKLLSQINVDTENVSSVTFSPDGAYILSGSSDSTISIWPANGLLQTTDAPQGAPSPVVCVAFSADGSRFASGCDDGSVCVWAIHDGRLILGPLKRHDQGIMTVAFSPDQSHIVSVAQDGSLFTWNAQNGSVVSGPIQGPVTGEVWSMAISPDVTRVVSGFDSGAMCVWGADDGKVVVDSFEGHSGWIYSLAFSPDGTRIVSGSLDKTVCVWNAHDGTCIAGPFTAHTSYAVSVSFSPDGLRIASGSADRTICVHNLEDGKLVASPFKGHNRWVMFVAFSPDGTLIVSGSTDGEVRVWNAHTGKQVAGPFTGAHDSIGCVAFSPDGRHIVCCRNDRTVRFIPVSPPPASASVPALDGELKIDESGWLVNEQGQHLLCVPPHIRPFFPSVHEPFVIFSDGTINADYSGMLIGDEWSKCYAG